MRKQNLKKILVVLFTLIMVFVLCLSLFACAVKDSVENDDDTKDTTSTTDTAILKNGTFSGYTGTSAPYAPSSNTWKTSSSSSIKTNYMGIIHADHLYAAESADRPWKNIANPGKANEDDEDSTVFMIYNEEEDTSTVYQSFTTSIGGYYKITLNFKVVGGVDELVGGAYVTFSGDVMKKFGPFTPQEDNSWQTITMYIESNRAEAQSITVTMSLGDSQFSKKANGCAFFDNVVATKIQKSDYDKAKEGEANDLTGFYTMTNGSDPDFINTASDANIATPNAWTRVIGKDDSGNTLSTNYLHAGVANLDKFDDWKNYIGNSEDEENVSPMTPYEFLSEKGTLDSYGYSFSTDSRILMISNFEATQKAQSNTAAYTAVGYTSKSSLAIELGKYYELKVWVYTDLVNFDYDAENKRSDEDIDFGARIVLTGIGDDAVIEDINTNKEWVEYTFVIVGHEYRTKSLGIELWLGNGVEGENKLACGTVLFDNIRLVEMGEINNRDEVLDHYNDVANSNPNTWKVVDIKSLSGSNLTEGNGGIDNPNFTELDENDLPMGWDLSVINDVKASVSEGKNTVANPDVIVSVINTKNEELSAEATDDPSAYWKEHYGITANPGAPYPTLDNVLMINNVNASAYQLKMPESFEILPNLHYRVGLWIKTVGIKEGTGATITLMNDTTDSAMSTFKTVNTENYENELTNDYAEYVFYVQGSNFQSSDIDGDTIKASLILSLGSGHALDSSSYVGGALFIANINIEKVTNSEYKQASSKTNDYVKTNTLAVSKGTVSNGSFNSFEYDEKKIDPETGYQTGLLKPSNWTLNSSIDTNDVVSGVLNTNNTSFIDEFFGTGYQVYTAWATGDIVRPIDFGKPNVLAIDVQNPTKASLVYSSSSISLSMNSYYMFKMNAMVDGLTAQIAIEANNNSVPVFYTMGGDSYENDTLWEEITFFVQTGALAAPSITIKIYVGDFETDNATKYDDEDEENQAPTYTGRMFVDNVTYYSITESEYLDGKAEYSRSYMTDSFDTTSLPQSVVGPNSATWTGSGEKYSSGSNLAKEENWQYAGIAVKGSTEPDSFYMAEEVEVEDEDSDETKKEWQKIEGTELTTDDIWRADDSNVLIINNQRASYFKFQNKSSISLDANSYYKLTIIAKTVGVAQDKFAYVEVKNSTDTYRIKVNTEYTAKIADGKLVYDEDGNVVYEPAESNEWTTYTFFFKTAQSSKMTGVTISMILGTSDDKVQGTALFDNVCFEKLEDSTEFDTAYSSIYELDEDGKAKVDEDGKYIEVEGADIYRLTNRVIRNDDQPKDAEPEEPETPVEKAPTNFAAWAIPTIIIAAIMIVVIVIWLIRRFVPKGFFKRKKTVDYARVDEEDSKKADKHDKNSSDDFKD